MRTHFTQRVVPLLLGALPTFCCAKDPQPNTGEIDLVGNITMQVHIAQPGGACASGHAWHTTYGGCRRAVSEKAQQREACGVDYTGEQVRSRTRLQYIPQSTGQTVNDPWGAWSAWDRSACTVVSRRIPGVTPNLIALVLGSEISDYANAHHRPAPKASPFTLPWGTRGRGQQKSTYAVTLDRTTAQLRCVLASETTSGNGENVWEAAQTWLLGANESVHTDHGHCQISHNQTQAHIVGDCDRTSGGDADECLKGEKTVSILSVSPCSAIVGVRDSWLQRHTQYEYPLCS